MDTFDNVPVQHQSSPINPNQSLNPSDPIIDEDSTLCDSSTSQPSSNIPRSLNPSAYPFFPTTRSSGYVPQDHAQSSSPVHSQPSTPDQTSSQDQFQHLSPANPQPLSADNSQSSFPDHLQRLSLCPASVHHSHSIHSQSLPQPQLIDLEEDDDFNTDSPPRPSSNDHSTFSPEPPTNPHIHNSSPIPNFGVSRPIHNQQIWLEAEVVLSDCTKVDSYVTSQRDDPESEVALNGCTNENSDSPSQYANLEPLVSLSDCTDANRDIPYQLPLPTPEQIPSQLPPNPPVIPTTPSSHQTYPESSVALSGCTNAEGEFVTNQSSTPESTNPPTIPPSPTSASQDPFIIPPPLSESFLTSSSNMPSVNNITPSSHANLEPSVAFNGYTVGNSDAGNGENIRTCDESNSSNTSEFVCEWSSRISTVQSFDDFCSKCDDFASAVVTEARASSANKSNRRGRPVQNPRNRPYNRLPNQNRRPLRFNPMEARRIQTLFRLSKKRAARRILQENNTTYTGTKDQANDYFTDTFSTSSVDLDDLLSSLSKDVPTVEIDQTLMDPMSSKEIKGKLKSMSNSAPGKDKVEYRHLKLVDPNCSILGLIFNKCLAEKKIPRSWKESTTILIYKKGSSDEPSNFRPIALMSCIYKLFTSILSSRISNFAIKKDLISPEQKSAKPAEGCHEHSFTLQSVIADCKRNQKNCFLAWLDLRNAFGSISHDTIYTTLEHMGFPESLISLIKDIYTDSSTVVRVRKDEETEPIPVNAGVKQGCPVSPILFNLTTELLIRSAKSKFEENSTIPFQLHGNAVYVLAYADDLVLMSRTRSGLQSLLDNVSLAADTLNLNFRPDKCATLSLTCSEREPDCVGDTIFKVQRGAIPVLKKEELYRYLGVPIGLLYDANDMNNIMVKLISDLEKIRDSLLTPWQKLDAIRTFIQPCLTYALRTCPVTRLSLAGYRKKLIEVLRSICNLPKRATQHYKIRKFR